MCFPCHLAFGLGVLYYNYYFIKTDLIFFEQSTEYTHTLADGVSAFDFELE